MIHSCYPVSLNVRGRRVVVVGGGNVAERKIGVLLEAGANVRVVAPSVTGMLEDLVSQQRIEWSKKSFEAGDLDGAFLAFAATSDDAVNAAAAEAAKARGILVNDAGRGERGDFFTPAIHRRDSVTIAIDTGGTAPAVAKLLREQIGSIVEHCLSGSLVCASRASALAMIQTRSVMAKLARSGIASTVVTLTTKGDEVQDRSLASIGTDSVFVRELELALRERRADFAVHSCKDLPSVLPDDMQIVAIVERADRRDVFCSERYPTLSDVPAGGVIGTSSPRRAAQLRALRPDLDYRTIRGNVDTRLRKLRSGDYDAIVLAAAGLERLGLGAAYSVPFPTDVIVPAVAQGALAVETRRGDAIGAVLRGALNDAECELEVLAERAFLRGMRGGCQAPIGASAAHGTGGSMLLRAAVGLEEGNVARGERRAAVREAGDAEALGAALAAELGMASLERTT